MQKTIIIDCGIFTHTSIFSYGAMLKKKIEDKADIKFIPPPGYTYFSMIISALKKIGVDTDDIIIMAMDGRDSWRKDLYAPYKAQRKEFREKQKYIDWDKCYGSVNQVNDQLKNSTNFQFIQIPKIEADDIASVACRFFKDNECVVVSGDADLEQLAYYNNVKIFSTNIKIKGTRGAYKIIDNPIAILNEKARKGDVSDNILVEDSDTENDYNLRCTIIDLLNLPQNIEEQITQEFLKLNYNKSLNIEELPYPNSLGKKFTKIYDKDKIITYEDCLKLQEKREKKKKKKAKERYEKKKAEKSLRKQEVGK